MEDGWTGNRRGSCVICENEMSLSRGSQDKASSVQSLGSEDWGKCGRYEVGWYSCHWSMVGEALGGLWPWILNMDDVLKIITLTLWGLLWYKTQDFLHDRQML